MSRAAIRVTALIMFLSQRQNVTVTSGAPAEFHIQIYTWEERIDMEPKWEVLLLCVMLDGRFSTL